MDRGWREKKLRRKAGDTKDTNDGFDGCEQD